jgi:hypothetical protein
MERINRRGALQRMVAAGMAALGRPGMVRAVPVQDLRARIVALGIPGPRRLAPWARSCPAG